MFLIILTILAILVIFYQSTVKPEAFAYGFTINWQKMPEIAKMDKTTKNNKNNPKLQRADI